MSHEEPGAADHSSVEWDVLMYCLSMYFLIIVFILFILQNNKHFNKTQLNDMSWR